MKVTRIKAFSGIKTSCNLLVEEAVRKVLFGLR